MTPAEYLLLVLIGAIASAINVVAGGGTLVTFPVLTVGLGIPPLIANATNSVSLAPGSLAGAFGLINHLAKCKSYLVLLGLPTLLGATAGAFLLSHSSERLFSILVPVLILLAAVMLSLQPKVKALTVSRSFHVKPWIGVLLQFLVSLYGGYFGAGMGIMMLATFSLYMDGTIHELNAVKNWLGTLINLVATVIFVAQGLVLLGPALALTLGSILGGFGSARISQRVDPERLRVIIAVYGFLMAGYFAYQAIRG